MAEIELVIKIHEEQYKFLKEGIMSINKVITYPALMADICERIANGTPLPKRHGDLIDRKDLLRLESKWYHLRNGDVACPKIDIDNALTIIEAESEVSDETRD